VVFDPYTLMDDKRLAQWILSLGLISTVSAGTFTDVTVAAGLSYDQHDIAAPNGVRQNWLTCVGCGFSPELLVWFSKIYPLFNFGFVD